MSVFDLEQDIMDNLETTSSVMKKQKSGSIERANEAKIYENLVKALNERDRRGDEFDFNQEKLKIEKYKIDEDIILRREIEYRKLDIEKAKAEAERKNGVGKLVIQGVSTLAAVGMGLLTLKYNMEYGGLSGRDSKDWLKDLFKVKP